MLWGDSPNCAGLALSLAGLARPGLPGTSVVPRAGGGTSVAPPRTGQHSRVGVPRHFRGGAATAGLVEIY